MVLQIFNLAPILVRVLTGLEICSPSKRHNPLLHQALPRIAAILKTKMVVETNGISKNTPMSRDF